ncbi:gp44 [Bacillus phage G]|uniref:Gp44 n=1 Tax=Bacillus phage G TaxID=2884420 RepID=G3MBB4_9CAUD|nr:gp44 [Bacillus phage G]AEO93315.1 gp44 [Bacillus phage G]
MARKNIKVDFGYQEDNTFKGSVFIVDKFEDSINCHLERIIKTLDERDFEKVVLYPLHENTLKRMNIDVSKKYFSRLDDLENLVSNVKTYIPVSIDKLDGKRKKYTPLDFILNHLTEKHKKPYFVCLSKDIANKFASYSSFDTWIKEVRLIIAEDVTLALHKNLEKNSKRIEFI